jgi:hypothetical protein
MTTNETQMLPTPTGELETKLPKAMLSFVHDRGVNIDEAVDVLMATATFLVADHYDAEWDSDSNLTELDLHEAISRYYRLTKKRAVAQIKANWQHADDEHWNKHRTSFYRDVNAAVEYARALTPMRENHLSSLGEWHG